jgi:PKD repeat protein
MTKFLMCLVLVFILAGTAFAADGAPGVLLYNGDAANDSGGMALSSWGSGYITESYNVHYIGPQVLRLLSQGYYQGGVLTFKQPVPLEGFLASSNAYLELLVKPSVVLKSTTGTTTPTTSGTTPMNPMGGFAGGGMMTNPTTPSTTDPNSSTPKFLLQRLRIILVTDKGELVMSSWPLYPGNLMNGGWRQVAIPLAAFKSTAPAKGDVLRGIRIFADRADQFYIAQIGLNIDNEPLRVKATAKPTVAHLKERVKFLATADVGVTSTKIAWTFDSKNGITTDALGPRVEWIYEKPGVYTVTCTISDEYGNKPPASATTVVTVVATEATSTK